MRAEQFQQLPSSHPFQHDLHVCFAIEPSNTSFLQWGRWSNKLAAKTKIELWEMNSGFYVLGFNASQIYLCLVAWTCGGRRSDFHWKLNFHTFRLSCLVVTMKRKKSKARLVGDYCWLDFWWDINFGYRERLLMRLFVEIKIWKIIDVVVWGSEECENCRGNVEIIGGSSIVVFNQGLFSWRILGRKREKKKKKYFPSIWLGWEKGKGFLVKIPALFYFHQSHQQFLQLPLPISSTISL